ncbi:MAG TPA: beta-galactosidase [Chthoniobacteraceae bacterium]|nr:beta-galactosidase [Chthoniobacteraceae bacterium]
MTSLSGIGIELCFEHHPRERWPWYADRARELGVSFVRMGEFIWDLLESREGHFHFDDLDAFIALLAERDIRTWLATPTAAPPDWLCTASPEILPVSAEGVRARGETRRHTCPTSPAYRRHAHRIVTALGRRYSAHPAVAAWQIDNELGHPFCFCPLCHRAFQRWLEKEFAGDIAAFNAGVGQFFWARTSRRFEEIPLPGPRANPCLQQIYQRFMDHQIRECWGLQAQWLREAGVTTPITTNAMLTWHGYDHEKFFSGLDMAAGDIYPSTRGGLYQEGTFAGLSFLAAFLRGMKHGRNFGIAEMRCGPAAGRYQYPLPGEVRYWSHLLFGSGADFVSFFRLDTCPSGRERNECGMLPASGAIPPIFTEVQQLCREAARLAPFLRETTVERARVGLLYSFPTHVALNLRPEFAEFEGPFGNGYPMHLARHFRAMVGFGIPVDVVYGGDDFSQYSVLVVSGLAAMEEPLALRLKEYVARGGVLLLWPWSGVMDENAKMHEQALPAYLCDVAGVETVVTEECPPQTHLLSLENEAGPLISGGLVQTLAPRDGAEVLAFLTGHPAQARLPGLVRHRFGDGVCYSVATMLGEDGLVDFYRTLLGRHGIAALPHLPPGVHTTRRRGAERDLLFLFSSAGTPVRLAFSEPVEELLGGTTADHLLLEPLGIAVLHLPAGEPMPPVSSQ